MLLSWCGWHIQVLCSFYENVDMSMLWSIWSPWQNKTGATATNPKMMPRQHIGSGSSWRYRRKENCADVWNTQENGGVLPVTGFPRYGVMVRKRVTACDEQVGHGANTSTPNIASIRSRTSSRGYTFKVCKWDGSRSVQSRGSRRSQDVRSAGSRTQRR